MSKTRKTRVEKPKPAFTAIVKEGELMMNLSWGSSTVDDGEGNPVTLFVWVNGDWKVNYKGKEYIIPVNENVGALIDWINAGKP